MEDLALYNPFFAGQSQRIDTPQSDLDIVMEVYNFDVLSRK